MARQVGELRFGKGSKWMPIDSQTVAAVQEPAFAYTGTMQVGQCIGRGARLIRGYNKPRAFGRGGSTRATCSSQQCRLAGHQHSPFNTALAGELAFKAKQGLHPQQPRVPSRINEPVVRCRWVQGR